MQIIIRIFTFICLLLSIQAFAEERTAHQIVEHNPKVLPELPLYDLDGKEVFLDSLEGNVVLLHFWATWCTQCGIEMQKMNRLQKMVRKDPVIIIPISEDYNGIEKIKEFYKNNHLRYLLSFVDKKQQWYQQLSLTSLPVTFILNGHMEHIATVKGSFDWNDEDNIKRIKSFILQKESQNPDYVDLLSKQDNLLKDPPKEPEIKKKKELPREAMTDVAPLDMDKINKDDTFLHVTNTD